MFSTAFTFARRAARGVSRGVAIHLDVCIFAAIVRDEAGNEASISLDPHDCTDALLGVVRHGGAIFRVSVDASDDGRAACLHLQVCEEELARCASRGSVNAEEHVIQLAKLVWCEARVPVRDTEAPSSDDDVVVPAWNESMPLMPHQRRTLQWMRSAEAHAPRPLPYAGNLHIGTGWYVDVENECFTRDQSPREAHVLGGVCADGTGTGKTATLLALVASDRHASRAPRGAYATRATLVVVPLNLVAQWQHEVRKFLPDDSVSVRFLVHGRDVRTFSMDDVCSRVDLIVTTFHFLRSCKAYTELVDAALEGRARTRAVLSSWARTPGHEAPVLEAVTWRRVVVDELHDTFESTRDLRHLRLFRSEARWGLTATPALDTDQAQQLYLFLEREKAHHPNLLAELIRVAVRDHTVSTPATVPRLHRVAVTGEERTRDLLDSDAASVARRSALDESGERARESKRDALQLRVDAHERTIRVLTLLAPELEAEVDAVIEAQTRDNSEETRDRLDRAQRALEAHARDLAVAHEICDSQRHRLERLDATTRAVRDRLHALRTTSSCPRCDVRECNAVMRCCARAVCDSCAPASGSACPMCHAPSATAVPVPQLRGVGTKMTRISEHITEIDEPVVMFVQWKSMVRGARAFLRSTGLVVHSLDGNARQRALTLAEFERGGVLLLCLEDSFAGLHLPHAHHVVFAHAIVGDRRLVEAMERQAVARCSRHGQTEEVQVVSFVVNDSEEECLWVRTH